jgi:hypothetical protein
MIVLGETMNRRPIDNLCRAHRDRLDGERSAIQEFLHGCIIASVPQLANLLNTLASAA